MNTVRKIQFIVPLRLDRSPSQRFRFEQYLDFFKNNGYEIKISYLVSEKDDKMFYSKGYFFQKTFMFFRFFFIRIIDVLKASKFDIIFIQREAFFLGFTIFEKLFSLKSKTIFDFDDSIWIPNVSDANKKYNWLKNPSKTSKIISYSHMIFAGNKYLAAYASQFNKNIKIVPTTIDTNEYQKVNTQKNNQKICIGWSGSVTTIQHFNYAIPALKKILEKYKDQIEIKVIGDKNYNNPELGIAGLAWIKEVEIFELSTFDIGIMPLPDDEWAKGKCGLKGLQYMALEIPTIMSPVGVNTEIIQDGENGFLASSEAEWIEKLSLLIESPELREKIGKAGRQTVIEKYSVESQKHKYLSYFNELLDQTSTKNA